MAKVKAPLMSFSAAGAIAESLVYFDWKGINAVRQYVIPANPRSTGQVTQRGYMTGAVADYHNIAKLDADDKAAWNRYAGILEWVMSGFNAFCRSFIDLRVLAQTPNMGYNGSLADDADHTFTGLITEAGTATAVNMIWGFSKTALVYTQAGVEAVNTWTCSPATLVGGRRIFGRFRIMAAAVLIGETGLFQVDVA